MDEKRGYNSKQVDEQQYDVLDMAIVESFRDAKRRLEESLEVIDKGLEIKPETWRLEFKI